MDNLVHWSNSVPLDSVLVSSGLLNGLSNCSIFVCLAGYLKAAQDPWSEPIQTEQLPRSALLLASGLL